MHHLISSNHGAWCLQQVVRRGAAGGAPGRAPTSRTDTTLRRSMVSVLALLFAAGLRSVTAATSVIHVVVDDLGRADLGFRNNMTHSPTLDAMARGGVVLDSHYVFQVCAPTRASIMTGRYPWGIGFYYVGGDNLGVPLQYEMLPQVLRRLAKAQKSADVATVAIGKWHNGALLKAYTPTYRGFESYFGYYHAAVNSYWYHGGEGGGCEGTDLSNSTGLNGAISPANRPDINGTYSTIAFTAEATRIISLHDVARPLYMYLAYEAVHDAGGSGVTLPVQAPLDQVERYASRVVDDTYKVQSAMIAVLDEGIANITEALDAKGTLSNQQISSVFNTASYIYSSAFQELCSGTLYSLAADKR